MWIIKNANTNNNSFHSETSHFTGTVALGMNFKN